MSVVVINRRGKEVTLLNSAEKGNKYALELKGGRALTNKLDIKKDYDGNPRALSDTQKAYRSGYLQAHKDSAKAFKHRHPRYKRKTM